jgi:hypothetical protein
MERKPLGIAITSASVVSILESDRTTIVRAFGDEFSSPPFPSPLSIHARMHPATTIAINAATCLARCICVAFIEEFQLHFRRDEYDVLVSARRAGTFPHNVAAAHAIQPDSPSL